ncbi:MULTISPECIES: type I polyketide synthase [unclassified Bifidobacterium]|uniref:type I polyketide synthase n=1 Tax=unclassified Bifidobacterium TaxID=2608897 RepID=UPI0011260901|nr:MULTISPECIES: type I polyketide synthase [unclassified Bifidobacterium]TPF77605.1 ACP S-malonyltransferase [Bifidobacterium sp. UTCIF-1]TPF79903.1 ACP S-malonyltransferase [Bifidobacterium sp. UTCIF-24]TPF84392.1 ACP S-malonyltransferase [Bifidobacterium sp. UTCIF-36]
MTTFFLNRLASEPHALAFAGQSTPWPVALADQTSDPSLAEALHNHAAAAHRLLAPVAADLLATTGRPVDLFGFTPNPARLGAAADATVSVEGIALTQLGALLDLEHLGYALSEAKPVAVLGHSQGVLAVHMSRAIEEAGSVEAASDALNEILATAALIGAAGTRRVRELGLNAKYGDATPMLSVKGADKAQVETLIDRVRESGRARGPISIAVTNSSNHYVLSGYPEDLSAFALETEREHKHQAKLREQKLRGGTVFDPTLEYLDVTLPFHSPLMNEAVEQAVDWAASCGFDQDRTRALAEEVLVNHVDWNARVKHLLDVAEDPAKLWVVDLGPGNTVGKLIGNVVEGTGVGVVEATTLAERAGLSTLDGEPERTQNWKTFAPHVVSTPAGDKLVTKFSRLTGKPPVLLPGMTPTTVDPEIVAAAANAGYWAELAGGGQVTAEVFDRHVAALEEELEEGRTVEFNAMFMDRYLWNLQFGSSRIVPKKRASGAPFDGVVVSAGIPELDEAVALIKSLHADGLPYVSFKPGTVDQIRQVVRIAKAVAPAVIMIQVEGGEAGGHHSWEALDDLLSATYADVRACDNLVLIAGGGIGTPERAADYISGQWSRAYGLPDMPVDGVMVGTAAMTAKEAHTSPEVKQLLVKTAGIPADAKSDDVFAPQAAHWVPSGKSVGGVSSGLSHLHADIYELENDSAECGRLLVRVMKHPEELDSRRKEIIEALNKTAKPYFGDLASMTYLEWAQRFAELAFPWVDPTYVDRFQHLLQRIEARVGGTDSGSFASRIFAAEGTSAEAAAAAGLLTRSDIAADPAPALAKLAEAYPQAAELKIVPADVAWFPVLVREYPKPMPFVPVIDHDLLRWWGQDQLWQSEDSRYSADSVRAIPGPISVGGITTVDEPIADILGRFENAAIDRVKVAEEDEESEEAGQLFAALGEASDAEDFIRKSPNISWVGHITDNPAYGTALGDKNYEITAVDAANGKYDLDIHLDTYWDNDPDGGASKHAVRDIVIPLVVDGTEPGRVPVVDRERLIPDVYAMLAATAGIGNTAITGDKLVAMPEIVAAAAALRETDGSVAGQSTGLSDSSRASHITPASRPFGEAHATYTLSANLGFDHEAATGAALPATLQPSRIAPDALVGPAWPAIYAALGSVYVDGYPVIEGLLNAVHLDHLIELEVDEEELLRHTGETVNLTSWAEDYFESASGRVVTIHVTHTAADGTLLARETERFAIRGRVYSDALPADAPEFGDAAHDEVEATPRRMLRRVKVTAPTDMTAFARTSGDFNPIHTSVRGARISGLQAPLVHGMWLSATAQHAVQALDEKGAHYEIAGWTYNMYGMVQLGDVVEISVERVGKVRHSGMTFEVTCRIDGQLVSRGTALVRAPRAAFVYPGQGIQKQGMVLDERAKSAAARDVWERADKLTRAKLGFSIIGLVRDNPKELTANGVTYRHPEGLLNLTQFTQVALATVAFAQTARLREAGADIWPAYFAGHSLGEYNALSAFAGVIPLETVLELVFHRGSTMHHLIDRDAQGRSNYRMGALRPNQFGVDDAHVRDYVESVAKASGEFLQIVNYNLAGQQYAIAGTIAGLKAFKEDANRRAKEAGGKPAFMLVPGIDVPFHSTLLRKGVPEFRDKLDALLPQHIDYRGRLVGRYIPNLVAAPFEMTKEFAAKILEVVPSERIKEALDNPAVWDSYAADDQKLGRLLLTELLSWQFASPVRWIETQALLFGKREQGGLGVEEYVEVGLGNAPTLANLGAKTLRLPEFAGNDTVVYNVGRDEGRVYMTDSDSLVPDDDADESASAAASAPVETAPAGGSAVAKLGSGVAKPAAASAPLSEGSARAAGEGSAAVAGQGSAGASVPDLPFKASDAIGVLMAYSAKLRIDQIGSNDTTDTLTNGVSSRRNQLLMDISSELGVASVDGAAEATLDKLAVIVNKAAPNYKPFGAVLSEALRDRLRALFGAAGVKQQYIRDRVTNVWQLGEGWVASVLAALLLDTREGASSRGGDLAKLPTSAVQNKSEADKLIDAAVEAVAQLKGVAVALPTAGGAAGGAVVDSAALDAFAEKVTGANGVLAATARFVLNELGVAAPVPEEGEDENAAVVAAVDAELGSDWPKQVAPRFDANKAILFDDRWASAREDLARAFYEQDASALNGSFIGLGKAIAAEAQWYASQAPSDERAGVRSATEGETKSILRDAFARVASEALEAVAADKNASRFANDIAIVTGVSPNSIAAQVVEGLLAGGATVVATSHSFKPSIKAWAKQAYREHATGSAKLWLVPANLSSYRDVDALVDWVGHEQKKTSGATTTILKPAWEPTLFFPFAAPPVHGTLADAGDLFESQARLMLWGVERAIAGFSKIGEDTNVQHKLHVVLPGSPNRGVFGGDGAYGEVKSAFDAIVNRARAERDAWAGRVTFAHPKIGWVRGTGLMGGNDPLVAVVERHGIHTYSTAQIAVRLLDLCTAESRAAAVQHPLDVDLTGGLGSEPIDIKALRAEAMADAAKEAPSDEGAGARSATEGEKPENSAEGSAIKALPTPIIAKQAPVDLADWQSVTARPEDEIVIVSIGELGPWGSGRTRAEAELGIHPDGTVDLSAGAVLELAWSMGLLTWQDSPKPGWYDTDGNLVPEEDIAERYHDEVVARSGIRPFETGMGNDYKDGADEEEAEVYLDHDVTFSVPSEEVAREYVKLDEAHTSIAADAESGEWNVTRHAGSMIRVPRRATMTRTVGGQFPTGFDPTRWGIPASMVGDVDEIALWNIVTTVDAYLAAGFTPTEILQSIHPSLVASTQGTGFGGMMSMRKLYLDRFLNHEIPTDILQEALPNVVAAHVMQSYIGGYGNMIQPVSACATAAVSLEEGVDKIALGKADFVVTGAIDDIGVESVIGFGNMNATANSEEMYGKGIDARFFSRANDRRRGGFLESQGGGTILVTRGDLALKLGLPVAAVVGFIHSYADGAHTSIPAPGLGALAAGLGGRDSKLVHDLARLGVTADDIAVVSKHDTSTNANDPNESELHNTLAHAIGRADGNPLFVISQKTLTGHAKGGACVFQVNGLTQLFKSGVIPGNASLDCVDPKLERDDHMVWLRKPLRIGGGEDEFGRVTPGRPVKAGLATSLGFGHVSGFVALVHPGAFEAAVAKADGEAALEAWRERANARLAAGQRHLEEGMMGRAALYEPIDNRRFHEDGRGYDHHEVEKAMLLNPDARLGESGFFEA